jgi:hypothetical protein
MPDALLLETVDNLLLETTDLFLLEELGTVAAGAQGITFTAPATGLGLQAGLAAITITAPTAVAIASTAAGAVAITFEAPAISVFISDLPVEMEVFSAALDELLVSMNVVPSSAAEELPVTMLVQDAGDAFVVTMDVVAEDFEGLTTSRAQFPVALIEDV